MEALPTQFVGRLDDKYDLERIIGSGGTSSVFLSKLEGTGQKTAIKILKGVDQNHQEQQERLLRAEYQTMSNLNNPNIIQIFGTGRGPLVKDQEVRGVFPYMVLEYAEKGDLFNYVLTDNKSGFSEEIGRTIFRQVLNAVECCHTAGYCHRDIKMENIMLDAYYNVKLCDFGFAAPLQGPNNDGLLGTPCGTVTYKAPEIWNHQAYSGIKVDIFALGVTLFALLSGKVPFERATRAQVNYRLIINRNWQRYWNKLNQYNVFPNGVSEEFKDLFSRMVAYDPNQRPSVPEILNHPWLQLRNATFEEVHNEFAEREASINQENISPSISQESDSNAVYRGENSSKYFTEVQKQYEDVYIISKPNSVIINGDINKPHELLSKFAALAENKFKAPVICSDKNLKFSVVFEKEFEEEENEEENEEEEAENEPLIVSVRLNYSTKNKVTFLNFMKDSGSMFDYIQKVKQFKELAKDL